MTTANMEDIGKNRMFCKLLFSVVCLLVVFHSAHSKHVVSFSQKDTELNLDQHSTSHEHARWKRSDETASERKDDKCDSQKEIFLNAVKDKRLETQHVFETETKFSLAMAWASTNDDGVLVVLTSELLDSGPTSTLWRSTNAGRNWANISSKVGDRAFRKEDGLQRNPHNPKWIYLISYELYMYVSEDGGDNWSRVELPSRVKQELIFHGDERYKDYIMVITIDNKLVVTEDNFKTKEIISDVNTHTAHWGTDESNTIKGIFAKYDRPGDNQHILPFYLDDSVPVYRLRFRSANGEGWRTIRENVVDFGIQGDFLYASVYKGDKPKTSSERLLVVSNDAGKYWNEAQLPTLTSDRFFSVLDMSEGLIFMHVDNPGDTGHGTLYTSWSKGIVFSESLQRHLYPNFNSITDFYRVESMKGTYIASQLSEDNSIHSVITFDLGGEWKPIPKPTDTPCHGEAQSCSLQIHNSYSLHRMVNAHPPMTVKDAVGLIIVNAHAAANLQITDPDVFISSDGGYSWRKALDGPHSYVIADSGGLIVAVSLSTPTPQELKFSTDEGRCWHMYKFTNETVHHTGLLTEPGGKSMTVALWGYRVRDKKWTVNVIDFADVITNRCGSSDYEPWMPHEVMKKEDSSRQGCLLGERIKYQRLKHDSWCRNGYEYKPDKSKTTCPCNKEDFECDYGYYRPNNQDDCVKEAHFKGPEIDICFRGHEQEVVSEGYRKIPGDVCTEQGGFSPNSHFINLTKVCHDRVRMPDIYPDDIKADSDQAKKTRNGLIVALVAVLVVIAGIGMSYFGYKIVMLRRHKVVYRYSMLNQNEDKNFDEEIERTLTGSSSHPHPMFGDSDEEELPAAPPKKERQVRTSTQKLSGYHDDSDDDMLN